MINSNMFYCCNMSGSKDYWLRIARKYQGQDYMKWDIGVDLTLKENIIGISLCNREGPKVVFIQM